MQIIGSGRFSHVISGEELSKGLRKTAQSGRNKPGMVICQGIIGKDQVLQTIDNLFRTDLGVEATFPYPQLFITTNFNVACTATEIYEEKLGTFESGVFQKVLTTSVGSTWDLVDFHDFLYLSNGRVAVVRDPVTHKYSIDNSLPTAMAMCNYNGQVIIGSPNAGYR